MLATVARIAERDVAALLAASLSPVQHGRRARHGRHDGQRDADRQPGTVRVLVSVVAEHGHVVRLFVVVVELLLSAPVCRLRQRPARRRAPRGFGCNAEQRNTPATRNSILESTRVTRWLYSTSIRRPFDCLSNTKVTVT